MSENGKEGLGKKEKVLRTIKEYVISLFLAILIALTIRHFVIEPFKIPSESMIPTLLVGDFIFVNKFKYGFQVPFVTKRFIKFKDPKKGEVVVFIFPGDKKKDFIKRVAGVAGDKLDFKDRTIYVNGVPVKTFKNGTYTFKSHNTGALAAGELYTETLGEKKHPVLYTDIMPPEKYDFIPSTVPKDHIFVMGDNRDNSHDSRSWGFVPLDNIKGEALIVWFSMDKLCDKFYQFVRWNRLFKAIK